MKTNNRMIRINDEIKKEVSELIRSGIKDPRLGSMVSVLKVETTQDLKYCKIYISVLGDDETVKNSMTALNSAKGFIRSRLASRINLRNTPELIFKYDDSLVYGMHISKILNTLDIPEESESEEDEQ
ncbi:MAG: 30S ribosome-binding factor RbfA [Clostridiales bacterium]|nr:30S ribosome-binding factor RbfA [Clostridiales bacterium]MCD8157541.1 30S ribosome-binding factor RbfA [Clostridiales bacterium]